MNVGVKPDGQDLDAKHVYPIPDVKMDTVLNPGNVFVQENSKECFVILYYQIRIPPRNTVTSILQPILHPILYPYELQRVKPHQFYQMEDRLTLITYQVSLILKLFILIIQFVYSLKYVIKKSNLENLLEFILIIYNFTCLLK